MGTETDGDVLTRRHLLQGLAGAAGVALLGDRVFAAAQARLPPRGVETIRDLLPRTATLIDQGQVARNGIAGQTSCAINVLGNRPALGGEQRQSCPLAGATGRGSTAQEIACTIQLLSTRLGRAVRPSRAKTCGSAPPFYREHQKIPGTDVRLRLAELQKGRLEQAMAFQGYPDSIVLRRIVRVRQANDAMAWSSPIWVGGYPSR